MNAKYQPISEYYVNHQPKVHINNKYPSQHNHLSSPKSQEPLNKKNRELIFEQISKILNSESNQEHKAQTKNKKVCKVKKKNSESPKEYQISKSVETQKYTNKLIRTNSKLINIENSSKTRILLKSISKYPYFHSESPHEKKILFVLQSPQESSQCIAYMQTFKNCSNKRIITIRAMEEYFYFKYDENEGENYLILGPLVAAKELVRFSGVNRVFVFGGNAKAITKLISKNVCRAALVEKEMDNILKEEGFDKNTPNVYILPFRLTKNLNSESKARGIDLTKACIQTELEVPFSHQSPKTKAVTNQSSTNHHSEYLTRSNSNGHCLKGNEINNSEKESITNLLKIQTKKSVIDPHEETNKGEKIKESKVIISASEPHLQMSRASSDHINLGISSIIHSLPHGSSNNVKSHINLSLANESLIKSSNHPKSPDKNNMENASIPSLPLSKSKSKISIKRNFYGFKNLEQKFKNPTTQSQNSLKSSIYKNSNHTESIIIFQQATPSSEN